MTIIVIIKKRLTPPIQKKTASLITLKMEILIISIKSIIIITWNQFLATAHVSKKNSAQMHAVKILKKSNKLVKIITNSKMGMVEEW